MSRKIIYNDTISKYYKDGNESDLLQLDWVKKSVNTDTLQMRGKKPSVLVGERIGVTTEQESNYDITMIVNGNTFITDKNSSLVLSTEITNENGNFVADEDIKMNWYLNGDKKTNRSVFDVNIGDLKDRSNNIISVECIIGEETITDNISILKYIGFEESTGGTPQNKSVDISLSNDTVIYNLQGNILSEDIVITANGKNHDGDVFYEFIVDNNSILNSQNNSITLQRDQFPKDGNIKVVKVNTREENPNSEIVSTNQKTIFTDTIDFSPEYNNHDIFSMNIFSSENISVGKDIRFTIEESPNSVPILGRQLFEDIKYIEWDFGDGNSKVEEVNYVNHSYRNSGLFVVTAIIKVKGRSGKFTIKELINVSD